MKKACNESVRKELNDKQSKDLKVDERVFNEVVKDDIYQITLEDRDSFLSLDGSPMIIADH